MVTHSKLLNSTNQCGHVDNLSTWGVRAEKSEKRFYQVYIDNLYKYSLIYKARSQSKPTRGQNVHVFVHMPSAVNPETAKATP